MEEVVANDSQEGQEAADELHKERGQSAPAKFDQSMHNHFGIDKDFYAKQFTQGNIIERMDPTYMEFFRLQQEMKMKNYAPEVGLQRVAQMPQGGCDKALPTASMTHSNLVAPITANDESEMLDQLKALHRAEQAMAEKKQLIPGRSAQPLPPQSTYLNDWSEPQRVAKAGPTSSSVLAALNLQAHQNFSS